VFGIPPHAWNDLFFTQLVKPWGEFMNSDVGTTKKLTMDVARISIRTSCQQPVDEFFDVLVNGETFRLRILEDLYGPMRIIILEINDTNGRDGVDNSGDEEEEDEEEEEEVEEIGRLLEEDTVVRESEGDQRNLLALTPQINALNFQDNLKFCS
jgi:Ran GTPase-activating protein (RanGAP) involved in mRNA processing and transport